MLESRVLVGMGRLGTNSLVIAHLNLVVVLSHDNTKLYEHQHGEYKDSSVIIFQPNVQEHHLKTCLPHTFLYKLTSSLSVRLSIYFDTCSFFTGAS